MITAKLEPGFMPMAKVINDYKETTYLIYGVYALYCVIVAFVNVRKFYKEQQEEIYKFTKW